MDKCIKLKNGNEIHYLQFGKGKPLILLPSLWLTSKSYTALAKQLSKYYKVYVPDLYKGKSSFLNEATNIDAYATELADFIKQIRLKDYYLVGISFSGVIVRKYLFDYLPKPKKLLLVSTTVLPFKTRSQRLNLLLGYFKLLLNNTFSIRGVLVNLMWIVDSIEFAIRHPKQFVLEGLIASSFELREIRSLPVSTKLIFAKKDEFVPFEITKKLMKVKNLELEIVDEFHGWFFKREKELAQKIYGFFQ
jgi:pimeloyl-ACP methyl ester carboxylesterase